MKTNLKNYYTILEVAVGASLEEIRQAYHRLVQANLDDDAMFADLREAYEVLTSPARREEYDRAQKLIDQSSPQAIIHCPLNAGIECPVLNARIIPTDTFCPDCGRLLSELNEATTPDAEVLPIPQTTARLEEVSGKVHPLHSGVNSVGRESGDVLLPDKTVSRQHARLELGPDGEAHLEDLGSTNGTQVNDKRLSPSVPTPIKEGDRLRFGSVALLLHLPPETGVAAAESSETMSEEVEEKPKEAAEEPVPAQVVETREEGGLTYSLLPGTTTFGRRAENTVVLTGDPYVSGSHATITAEGGSQYMLTDIGSTNGTLLNGERLPLHVASRLTHGDVILIGSVALRFEIVGMPLDEEFDSTEDLRDTEDLSADLDETETRETPREG